METDILSSGQGTREGFPGHCFDKTLVSAEFGDQPCNFLNSCLLAREKMHATKKCSA